MKSNYTVLFDISQLLSAGYLGGYEKVVVKEGNSVDHLEAIVRNKTITSLMYHCRNMQIRPTEMILAVDAKGNWRHDYFREYKGRRSIKKMTDAMDHQRRYQFFDSFIQELERHMGFQTISVEKCEADDVIGTIALSHPPNKMCVILSRDHDFLQLVNENVKIYDWFKKEWVVSYTLKKDKDLSKAIVWPAVTKTDARNLLRYQILMGDDGDDVPNVFGDDDSLVNPLKKKVPFGPVGAVKRFFTGERAKDETALKKVYHEHTDNFKRNVLLMDLRQIPIRYKKEIISKFNALQDRTVDIDAVKGYLVEHDLFSIADHIEKSY